MLKLQNISKSYNDKVVLNDINLEINAGETIALLGKSGSGKSTLLSLMAGLDSTDSGDIFLDGKSIAKLS